MGEGADRRSLSQAISSGFAIVERGSYLGIGTMPRCWKRRSISRIAAIELAEAHREAESASEAKSRFLAT